MVSIDNLIWLTFKHLLSVFNVVFTTFFFDMEFMMLLDRLIPTGFLNAIENDWVGEI